MADEKYVIIPKECLEELIYVLEGTTLHPYDGYTDPVKARAIKVIVDQCRKSVKEYIEIEKVEQTESSKMELKTYYQVRLYNGHRINAANTVKIIQILHTMASIGLQDAHDTLSHIAAGNYAVLCNFSELGEALDLYWNLKAMDLNVNIYRDGNNLIYGAFFGENDEEWGSLSNGEQKTVNEKRGFYEKDHSDEYYNSIEIPF